MEHRHVSSRADLVRRAVGIAAGTSAYCALSTPTLAEAVRFEADGFYWGFSTLDLTLPADQQTYGSAAQADGTSVYLRYFGDFYPAFSYTHSYTAGSGAEIWSGGFAQRYAQALTGGTSIDGSGAGTWNQYATFAFSYTACYDYGYYGYNCNTGERGLIPNDGSEHYVGVRLNIGGLSHYGWIGITNNFGYIDAFAWGYETEPGVPVAAGAPTPSTLAGLALGAAAFSGRKRRD